MGRLLYLDPSLAGISGNMLLGALLDLGAPVDPLESLAETVAGLTGEPVALKTERVRRHGFAARWMDWQVPHPDHEVPGDVFLERLEGVIDAADLAGPGRDLVADAGRLLVESEAAVHDTTPAEVRFHELGSLDTVLDLVGAGLLLSALGFPGAGPVYAAPVAVGSGEVAARHGRLPVPPFVTLEILRRRGVPYRPGPGEGEWATPTGVALLAALADGYEPDAVLRPDRVGYGAGGRDPEGVPNVLRAVLASTNGPGEEVVSVLETHVDDVSGETLGHLAGLLEASDALDFHLVPALTKKNRPSHVLQVLCPPGREGHLADLLMEETGTLGVRITRGQWRRVRAREVVRRAVPGLGSGEVRFKVVRDQDGRVVQAKPEHDDLQRAAEATGLTLREVARRARRVADELVDKG